MDLLVCFLVGVVEVESCMMGETAMDVVVAMGGVVVAGVGGNAWSIVGVGVVAVGGAACLEVEVGVAAFFASLSVVAALKLLIPEQVIGVGLLCFCCPFECEPYDELSHELERSASPLPEEWQSGKVQTIAKKKHCKKNNLPSIVSYLLALSQSLSFGP